MEHTENLLELKISSVRVPYRVIHNLHLSKRNTLDENDIVHSKNPMSISPFSYSCVRGDPSIQIASQTVLATFLFKRIEILEKRKLNVSHALGNDPARSSCLNPGTLIAHQTILSYRAQQSMLRGWPGL